ncbi:MAG: hypothetical protein ACQXXH_05290 [Candidatus Bathyarchaeia archaeon]|jgi:hypothetical protein|nr:hypothetical protein [Candidatus Bathyarchaeota archaeon A05DMB-4]MDH7595665.1 hypothetical protein [Candidatus Bathyarchaeota archaeon]
MGIQSKPRKATLGFLLSIVAGVFILLNGLVWFLIGNFIWMLSEETMVPIFALPLFLLGVLSILFAIAVFLGALVIYWFRKVSLGGKIVLVFSILSTSVGGGFLLGMALGVAGGAYSIRNK